MDPGLHPEFASKPYSNALAQCLDHWGLKVEATTLLRDGLNHVFASETHQGTPIILRISNGKFRTANELMGELTWLDHLIANGCSVTTPVRSRDGALLETMSDDQGTFHISCFQRFGGESLRPQSDPRWNDTLLFNLGREMGRIARASDSLELPSENDRKQWYELDLAVFADEVPECYDQEVVAAMKEFTREMIAKPRNPGAYGLIQCDLHSGNFMVEGDALLVIDFDLGCHGWRLMDFAILVFTHYYFPSLLVPDASPRRAGEVLKLLVSGYRLEYEMLSEDLELMGDLMKLRQILLYKLFRPDVEYWQLANSHPSPSIGESMDWIERQWREGRDLEIPLDAIH